MVQPSLLLYPTTVAPHPPRPFAFALSRESSIVSPSRFHPLSLTYPLPPPSPPRAFLLLRRYEGSRERMRKRQRGCFVAGHLSLLLNCMFFNPLSKLYTSRLTFARFRQNLPAFLSSLFISSRCRSRFENGEMTLHKSRYNNGI